MRNHGDRFHLLFLDGVYPTTPQDRVMSRQAFVSELGALVDTSPRRSLILLVNGFRERFPSALRKTDFVGHILDIPRTMKIPSSLGQMAIQGERGLLRISTDWMIRLRYNPFYDYQETRLLDWIADEDPMRQLFTPQTIPA